MLPRDIAALLTPYLGAASLTDAQLSQISAYLDLLLRWNERINLTSIRDPEPIIQRHFGESLFTAAHLYQQPETQNSDLGTHSRLAAWEPRLIDIGSGAGFPGLPIKIWAPSLRVTLIESQQRKATFLREVIRTLDLRDIDVSETRAEEFVPSTHNSELTTRSSGLGTEISLETGNRQLEITVTLRAVEHFHRVILAAVRILLPTAQSPASRAQSRLALLIGGSQLALARELAPQLTWAEPISVPHSTSRILLIGNLAPCA